MRKKTVDKVFIVAAILLFMVIFFVKDKNKKISQMTTNQQTIQEAP